MCGDIDSSRRPIFPRSNAIAPHSAYPSRLGLGLGAEIVEHNLTDRAVHYARRKDAYRVPQLGPLRIGVVAASTSSLRSPSTITDALSSLVSRSVLPVHGPG